MNNKKRFLYLSWFSRTISIRSICSLYFPLLRLVDDLFIRAIHVYRSYVYSITNRVYINEVRIAYKTQ
jgi:hypothetical protein